MSKSEKTANVLEKLGKLRSVGGSITHVASQLAMADLETARKPHYESPRFGFGHNSQEGIPPTSPVYRLPNRPLGYSPSPAFNVMSLVFLIMSPPLPITAARWSRPHTLGGTALGMYEAGLLLDAGK